ncbi:GGDEF domain-containing response regulator [Roseospirillum parvum]|uniref:Diguanylate cyclase (GGDEF) domain-containing protein n=1 Tax=Roseospirillum parvum TaxID=83401 RepID=A0A1G7UTA2_9PROT|nr:response regulator [Roseospirillum parvum]SDG50717.1 diguanylate cyclase (GGDEF) domain-containing protein [Roseospirillum parvum]
MREPTTHDSAEEHLIFNATASSGPVRVLVVDRDPLFARIVRSRLERWGFEVQTETSGKAALEWLKVSSFRLVITDVDLPGMSGPELTRRVRALQLPRYVYVMFYSARADKDTLLDALDAGADDYMSKPFNAIEFKLRIVTAVRLLALDEELAHGGGLDRGTGVLNRSAFEWGFRLILAQMVRTEVSGALVFIRLTNIGGIYARHGYFALLRVLRMTAEVAGRVHRQSDVVARLEGDEFCLLLHNTAWDTCRPVIERLVEGLSAIRLETAQGTIAPAYLVSVLNYPVGSLSAEEILDRESRVEVARIEPPEDTAGTNPAANG